MNKTPTDGVVTLPRIGLLNLICCAPTALDAAEVVERVNRLYPCGTTAGWVISQRENCGPLQCDQDRTRTHYLFDC